MTVKDKYARIYRPTLESGNPVRATQRLVGSHETVEVGTLGAIDREGQEGFWLIDWEPGFSLSAKPSEFEVIR
jgi:hypothetical protein